MTTTPMWHPIRAADRPIDHDDTRCLDDGAITLEERRRGDGGGDHCEHCTELLVQSIEAIWEHGASTIRPPGGGREPGERPTSPGATTP